MQSASATLESPLDSSKHIIAQLLRTVQCSLMQGFQLSALQLGFPPHAPMPHQFFNLINDLAERRRYIAALRLFSAFLRMYR
jgi:hypothetical protein